MLKRTCGILCSDTSIFEVLLCHINNFSSFTLTNVWWREFDFSSYLFKFLSVRPQYIRSTMNVRLCFFRKNLVFFRKIFVLFFREIFASSISQKFRMVYKIQSLIVFKSIDKLDLASKSSNRIGILQDWLIDWSSYFKLYLITFLLDILIQQSSKILWKTALLSFWLRFL